MMGAVDEIRGSMTAGARNSADPSVSVLVVEDDDDSRKLFHDLLEDEGYVAVGVADVSAALAYLRTAAASVVLLDYLLPQTKGAVLLRAAERDLALQRHRYVLMTAMELHQIAEADRQVIETICANIVFKPFDLDRLLQAVANAARH